MVGVSPLRRWKAVEYGAARETFSRAEACRDLRMTSAEFDSLIPDVWGPVDGIPDAYELDVDAFENFSAFLAWCEHKRIRLDEFREHFTSHGLLDPSMRPPWRLAHRPVTARIQILFWLALGSVALLALLLSFLQFLLQ